MPCCAVLCLTRIVDPLDTTVRLCLPVRYNILHIMCMYTCQLHVSILRALYACTRSSLVCLPARMHVVCVLRCVVPRVPACVTCFGGCLTWEAICRLSDSVGRPCDTVGEGPSGRDRDERERGEEEGGEETHGERRRRTGQARPSATHTNSNTHTKQQRHATHGLLYMCPTRRRDEE